jgi:hypothetical protein
MLACVIACCCSHHGRHCCIRRHDAPQLRLYKLQYAQKMRKLGTEQEFGTIAGNVQTIMDEVTAKKRRFIYTRERAEKELQFGVVAFEEEESHVYAVRVKGTEGEGEWFASGQLMMTEDGPFLWLMRVCPEEAAVDDSNNDKIVIYESLAINQEQMSGRWYFEELAGSVDNSGSWKIVPQHPSNESLECIDQH